MRKYIKFILMVFFAGFGSALSAFATYDAGLLRSMILGSILALSIAVGDYYVSHNRYKNNKSQALIGLFFGIIAATLIFIFDSRAMVIWFCTICTFPEYPIVYLLICMAYGAFFQMIIMRSNNNKTTDLFIVAVICISAGLSYKYYFYEEISIEKFVLNIPVFIGSAVIFVTLWYFPVWLFYLREHRMNSCLNCIALNHRMFKLVLGKRWLSKKDYAASYDKVAATYDSQWLCQLRPVTEELLAKLPEIADGDILDLGCGTGLSTAYLEERYPDNKIFGVDISPEMLNIAGNKCVKAELLEDDILEFLQKRPDQSATLIFSGWAIGYSTPAKIISEAARVLKPGGSFAFVVNYYDTLAPVFYAFRKCMNQYPSQVNMALWPKFPRKAADLLRPLTKSGFDVQMQEDSNIPIESPEGEITLEWLLKTGVLAGFDQVMPLRNKEIMEYFDQVLKEKKEDISHHYFMGIFTKK